MLVLNIYTETTIWFQVTD